MRPPGLPGSCETLVEPVYQALKKKGFDSIKALFKEIYYRQYA